MQPYLFPYLVYYQLINAVDKFVIYDDVSFIKQGWINRNQILFNGEAHLFSIPVEEISSFRLIRDTKLHPTLYPIWKKKFLQTLKHAYNKAPCYIETFKLVEQVLDVSLDENIANLSKDSIIKICKYLNLNKEFVDSSSKYANSNLRSVDRVVDICSRENATIYSNMAGGMELYNPETFNKHGIDLNFIKANILPYKQFNFSFAPGLSIIDVLMFNEKEKVVEFITQII